MTDAIVLKDVTKTFGSKVAVEDLSLNVPEGALYGFIGPNGAGKTTTIRMIMAILLADRGTVSVLGSPSALAVRDRTGYLPEERGVYRKMRVGAFLRFMGRLNGVDKATLERRIPQWLERVKLEGVERKRCEDLSKGMQQKLQFIAAVLHEPELLILDEPFSGLDPLNMRLLRELIAEQHERGATIIFSTHVMVHAEQICDHIVMIHNGGKVLDDSLAAIKRRYDPRKIVLEPLELGSPEGVLSSLRSIAGVDHVAQSDGHVEIRLVDDLEVGLAMQRIVEAVPPLKIEVAKPTLEDVFIEIAGAPHVLLAEGEEPLADLATEAHYQDAVQEEHS